MSTAEELVQKHEKARRVLAEVERMRKHREATSRVLQENRFDANETAFIAKELEYVKSEAERIDYPELKVRTYFDVDTEAPNTAEEIAYDQWSGVGRAKVVSDMARDFPRIEVSKARFSGPVKSLGSSYSYDFMELRRVVATRSRLNIERAEMARRAILTEEDEIACFGRPEHGIPGLLNRSEIGSSVAPVAWSIATPRQIIDFLTQAITDIILDTRQTQTPDTLLLPTNEFTLIATTPFSASSDTTILGWLLANNPMIRNVGSWTRLDASPGFAPRGLLYRKHKRVIRLESPQQLEEFPAQVKGGLYTVLMHARTGGIVIPKPRAVRYLTNITL